MIEVCALNLSSKSVTESLIEFIEDDDAIKRARLNAEAAIDL